MRKIVFASLILLSAIFSNLQAQNSYDEIDAHIVSGLRKASKEISSDTPKLITIPAYSDSKSVIELSLLDSFYSGEDTLIASVNLFDFYRKSKELNLIQELNPRVLCVLFKGKIFSIESIEILPDFNISIVAEEMFPD